mgnify:CR=1 FL=1
MELSFTTHCQLLINPCRMLLIFSAVCTLNILTYDFQLWVDYSLHIFICKSRNGQQKNVSHTRSMLQHMEISIDRCGHFIKYTWRSWHNPLLSLASQQLFQSNFRHSKIWGLSNFDLSQMTMGVFLSYSKYFESPLKCTPSNLKYFCTYF